MANKFNFPNLGFGMGLRKEHYPHILEKWPKIDWFEIISENYMDTDGRQVRVLERVARKYPIAMHGVSLSIGSADPIKKEYLQKLKKLADWVEPKWISDHLCWTGINKIDTHDLLPMPYTKESLQHIVERIKQVQDFLGRPILMENPSTYLEFRQSDIDEWDYIAEMLEKADCGLLLDVNNVYVNCYNHGWDEKTYLDAIPKDRVVQIHVAGHENKKTHIVDTHEGPIIDPVWDLYKYVIAKFGQITTMVEWDTNIPDFKTVNEEVEKARKIASEAKAPNKLPSHLEPKLEDKIVAGKLNLSGTMGIMQDAIITADKKKSTPEKWITPNSKLSQEGQLDVYVKGYRYRLFDVISEDFPALRYYLGDKKINKLIEEYVEATPSRDFNLSHYVNKFPDFIKTREYLKNDEFAVELAELETALTTIFEWSETKPMTKENLKDIAPENFLSLKIRPRKALRLFYFAYPVSDYFKAFKDEQKPEKPRRQGNYLAIYRNDDQMCRLQLDKKEYNLLRALFDDKSIEEAIGQLVEEAQFDETELVQNFQTWFARWLDNGLLAA